MTSEQGAKANQPGEIGHDEFVVFQDRGAGAIVDVREPYEYASGHIPGAINLPLSRFDPAELPSDKPVVLVCQAGARSAKALQAARTAGVEDVRHYLPGTGGWRARGGPIATD